MNAKGLFDLYVNYLMVSSGQVSAAGLSELVDGAVSHDKVTRLLSQSLELFESRNYWKRIKPFVRQVESEEGILTVDDFIVEKPHSSGNELIAWHHSHLKGGTVKGDKHRSSAIQCELPRAGSQSSGRIRVCSKDRDSNR